MGLPSIADTILRRLRRLCLPLLVCLAVPFCSEAVAQKSDAKKTAGPVPEWIWQSKTPQASETVYLRKKFKVDGKLKSALLSASCDNRVSMFVNGKHFIEHPSWEKPLRENLTSKLEQGDNVLVGRCSNAGGAAGFLVYLVLTYEDGRTETIVSDTSWLGSANPAEDWRTVDYDDSQWTKAVSFGKLGVGPWGDLLIDPRLRPEPQATAVAGVTVPEGFQVELLYSVPKESEGSWVSMTTDPQGRLICSDQYGGLYRITPGKDADSTKVEAMDVNIGEAQGLLYAFDSLYVMVNGRAAQGSGLYRVLDTNGDDKFDEVKLIKKLNGGGEHGPHAIRLAPDGKSLFVIAGNHTSPPEGFEASSPHRNYEEDLLLPRNPDGGGHATGRMAPGGWIAQTDENGSYWRFFCGGFRNPYDIDFNQDGELFTYDADMEWDTGVPWYRPTRVNHAVSAAEFGWRYGTGKWPDYYPDSLGSVVDIGLGSPTGIQFGTGAKFPAKYQRALYINDWTYGKIYAVHMKPQGASYTATFETFVQGRPLPVTDVTINPVDGAFYFTIGGRRTQSGLYRVTYVGDESTAPAGPLEDAKAADARALRHQLEFFHGKQDPQAIKIAWPYLSSRDRHLRYAARVAIENQPVEQWKDQALAETRTAAAIQACLALTRTAGPELQAAVLEKLNSLPLERLSEGQMLDALRTYGMAFIRLGGKQPETAAAVTERVNSLFPHESEMVNRELCSLLVYLEAPGVIERAMKLLAAGQSQEDQFYYAFVLRNLTTGWTPDERKAYFSWLNLAEQKYRGGNSFKKFIIQVRNQVVEKLSPEDKVALKDVIEGDETVEVVKLETTRQFVHNWQIEDLVDELDQVESGRSFEKGRIAYEAAQCYKCHRFAGSGGATGPDITGVGARFTPLYLLEAMILPSKVVSDQYQNHIISTADGEIFTGRIIDENDQRIMLRTHPFATKLTEIAISDIDERQPALVSEMPQGLINTLTKEEILDLIAYMRSAGDANDSAYKK